MILCCAAEVLRVGGGGDGRKVAGGGKRGGQGHVRGSSEMRGEGERESEEGAEDVRWKVLCVSGCALVVRPLRWM